MAPLFNVMEQFLSHLLCWGLADKWLTCSILWNSSWATSSVVSHTNGSPVLYYGTVPEPPPLLRTGICQINSSPVQYYAWNSSWATSSVEDCRWVRQMAHMFYIMKQFLSHLFGWRLPGSQTNGSPVRYYETVPEPPPLFRTAGESDKWLTCSILWNSSWATSSVVSQTKGSPVLYYGTIHEPLPLLRIMWVRQMAHLFYIIEQFLSHLLC